MTKRKSWTIFILLTLTLITLLIAPITVWYNLKHYSVYYAQHIPHKEEENPELVFIIENLFWIKAPTNLNLEYEELNHRIHVLSDKKNTDYKYQSTLKYDWESEGFRLSKYNYDGDYIWNEEGVFVKTITFEASTNKSTKINSLDEADIELKKIINPIIAIQPEPKLNLQWLFNWVHRDRFNQD